MPETLPQTEVPAGGNDSPSRAPKPKRNPKAPRHPEPALAVAERFSGCPEVTLTLPEDQALAEALRCADCVDPRCVQACPLHVDIKGFLTRLAARDVPGALDLILEGNPFPGICGRVCQHERFCENSCVVGKKFPPVAIGALERFCADYGSLHGNVPAAKPAPPNGLRVAIAGSGPSALLCASDLALRGYRVTVFEALHELGGVLAYGIPGFRLPREILRSEIGRLRGMGIEFRTSFLIGKTEPVEELLEQGYAAVFIATGAGLPYLMGIPGENLTGVYTANEFLTRLNLMEAWRFPGSGTPVRTGARTVVVGGGNSAMDAARWARRLGSETTILFRRGPDQLRARREEIERAGEEGIRFEFLAAPVRLIGDEQGVLRSMECIRMRLGEPDSSGRPSPVPIPGSEFTVDVDSVVAAVGQGPNPTVQRTMPLLATRHGKIEISGGGATSVPRVYAGGDVVRGGSTVIEAMRDGRAAAQAIHSALLAEGQPLSPAIHSNGHGALSGLGPYGPNPSFNLQPARPRRNRIIARRELAPGVVRLVVEAPEIARHWQCGQFVVVRPLPSSERVPLTLVDGNPRHGTITLVVQAAGKTTRSLVQMHVDDAVADVLGPLGAPATLGRFGTVLCVGGGVGLAELLPVARQMKDAGNHVVVLGGARSANLLILREEFEYSAHELYWATDDGSEGFAGTAVGLMRWWHERRQHPADFVHVIGPIPLMQAAASLTREWKVRTVASLNPIMVDGTGMCGGCRVTVDGKPVFACVDGPEFDAHQVDFAGLALRNRAYLKEEAEALQPHFCRIGLGC